MSVCKECQDCVDFMGTAVYPYYGLPPHQSFFEVNGEIKIGKSKIDPMETWPKNFVPTRWDIESDGVWFCPNDGCENSLTPTKATP